MSSLQETPEQVTWPRSELEAMWILARIVYHTSLLNDLGATYEAEALWGQTEQQVGD